MKLSEKAENELIELARAEELRKDMEMMKAQWKTPFIKDGRVDVDAYIEFVTEFNEFINHKPKPFKKIIEKAMRL